MKKSDQQVKALRIEIAKYSEWSELAKVIPRISKQTGLSKKQVYKWMSDHSEQYNIAPQKNKENRERNV